MSVDPTDPRLLTRSLSVNQLTPAAAAWYRDYLVAYDAEDLEAYARFLAPDCVMRGNNAEPVTGKAAILTLVGQLWRGYRWGRHELLAVVGCDRRFAAEALNHYERLDRRRVTIRACAFTDRDDAGLVQAVRFYGDAGALGD